MQGNRIVLIASDSLSVLTSTAASADVIASVLLAT
jgi:hypothetical protein